MGVPWRHPSREETPVHAQDLPAHLRDAPLTDNIFGGLRREHGFEPLRVEGRLPPELRGTLYRNGPAVYDAGRDPHWFDGNGAATAIRLDGQGAQGAIRVLHSPSADADAGRSNARYGGFRQRASWPKRLGAVFLGRSPVRNMANINVLPWQGRLFGLYETVPPLEVDPRTLATIGETDLDGVVKRAWNAHPRRVPSRRTTYQFGVRVGPRVFLDVYALPDEGPAALLTSLALPGTMEVHDFFVTERHLVFVLPPLWSHPLATALEGNFVGTMRWRPQAGSEVIVIPIDRPQEVQRLRTEPFFFWHGVNAYERPDASGIVLELIRYPDFAETLRWTEVTPGGGDAVQRSWLAHAEIDLRSRTIRWEERWSRTHEFASVHPAFNARRHRWAWAAGFAAEHEGRGWWDRLVRVDTERGEAERFAAGPRCAIGEPILVARSAAEDDVWVLAMVRDLDAGATHLAIWDGRRPDEGPVARAWFDQQLPPSLHGCWVAS
jgi:all-trans-8'-apo-beta-carotenal 15,15'-oxygenase